MNQWLWLLLFAFIVFTSFFALVLFLILGRKNKLQTRLSNFLPREYGEKATSNTKKKKEKKQKNIKKQLVHSQSTAQKKFSNSTYAKKWNKKLEQAGMKKTTEQFFMIRALVIAIVFIIFYILGARGIILYLSPIIGFYLPSYYVKRKIKKRMELFSEQLSEALGIIANGMRAGFSFMQALNLVAKEMPEPLGPEFHQTIREISLGFTMEEAFKGLLERIPSKELELVVNALLIQRSTGGNLAELLETMQETIRGRVRIKEELNTLTAQGRMSTWIVTALPPAIALYLNFMNPEYFQPMLQHPLGWLMLGFSIIFIIIGWLVIRKIVQIEV